MSRVYYTGPEVVEVMTWWVQHQGPGTPLLVSRDGSAAIDAKHTRQHVLWVVALSGVDDAVIACLPRKLQGTRHVHATWLAMDLAKSKSSKTLRKERMSASAASMGTSVEYLSTTYCLLSEDQLKSLCLSRA